MLELVNLLLSTCIHETPFLFLLIRQVAKSDMSKAKKIFNSVIITILDKTLGNYPKNF